MDIVVLFSNRGDDDCQRLRVLWDGLPNVTVFELTGDMCMEDVESATETALNTPCDILIVCGHGTPFGLLSPNWDYYVVHEYNCSVLNQRTTVGLFCHATNFATTNRLNGFYTDMFISNINTFSIIFSCCWKNCTCSNIVSTISFRFFSLFNGCC